MVGVAGEGGGGGGEGGGGGDRGADDDDMDQAGARDQLRRVQDEVKALTVLIFNKSMEWHTRWVCETLKSPHRHRAA